MRVLVNGVISLGARTGIGHYTAELYRSLAPHAGADEVHCFPSPWVRRARGAWARVRPWLGYAGHQTKGACA